MNAKIKNLKISPCMILIYEMRLQLQLKNVISTKYSDFRVFACQIVYRLLFILLTQPFIGLEHHNRCYWDIQFLKWLTCGSHRIFYWFYCWRWTLLIITENNLFQICELPLKLGDTICNGKSVNVEPLLPFRPICQSDLQLWWSQLNSMI